MWVGRGVKHGGSGSEDSLPDPELEEKMACRMGICLPPPPPSLSQHHSSCRFLHLTPQLPSLASTGRHQVWRGIASPAGVTRKEMPPVRACSICSQDFLGPSSHPPTPELERSRHSSRGGPEQKSGLISGKDTSHHPTTKTRREEKEGGQSQP